MRRYPRRYQKQALMGLVSLGIIFLPVLFKLPGQFTAFNAANELETDEQIERSRIAERKKTADKLNEAGVMPEAQVLKILKYYDNPHRDPKPETTGFLKDQIVIVVDSAGRCIGRIQKRKWLWKHYYKGVCNGIPDNK